MPISHIIFHAVLSMMHTLSYLALGHILIWRKLQPLDGLLKSGQAFSTEVREEGADRPAPPSDGETAAVSPCSIFSYRGLPLTCFLGASTIWEGFNIFREWHSPLVRHPCWTVPQVAQTCPFQADAAGTQGSGERHMESRAPEDTGALPESP